MRRFIAVPSSHPAALPAIPAPVLTTSPISPTAIDVIASYSGPPTLVTYSFFKAATLAGPYLLVATQAGALYHDTGLTAVTTYYYRVNVQTSDGRDSMFTYKTGTTPSPGTAPTAPSFLTFSNIASTTATANWGPATDPVGVTGYELSINSIPYINEGNVLKTDFAILTPSTLYTISVRAYNAAGLRGPPIVNSFTTTAAAVGANINSLASYMIGGPTPFPSQYNDAFCQRNSQFDWVVIGAYYGSGNLMYGGSRSATVNRLHSLQAPGVKCNVGQYFITDNIGVPQNGENYPGALTHLNAFPNEWAWTNSQNHTGRVFNWFAPTQLYQTNETQAGGVDNNGLHFQEYIIKSATDAYQIGGGIDGGCAFDFYFHDNVGTALNSNQAPYDYNQKGSTTPITDSAFLTSLHQGFASTQTWLQSHYTLPLMVNGANWNNTGSGSTNVAGMDGVFPALLIEGCLGATYNPEYFGGSQAFAECLAQIQFCQAHTAAPHTVVVQHFVQTNGTDIITSTAYQASRYGLCLARIAGAVYGGTSPSEALPTMCWFDEWSVNVATRQCYAFNGAAASVSAGRAWVVSWIDAAYTKTSNNVYYRRANMSNGGIACYFCNGRNNGNQSVNTLTLFGMHHNRLIGTQGAFNNGATNQTTINFLDRDGGVVILVP